MRITRFDCSAKSVLEELSDDIFEMDRNICERDSGLAINDPSRTDAVFQFADLGDEGAAGVDDGGRLEGGVDDANIRGLLIVGGWRNRCCWRRVLVGLG
jgi:hypothetical protein